jgi:hypothetical protein
MLPTLACIACLRRLHQLIQSQATTYVSVADFSGNGEATVTKKAKTKEVSTIHHHPSSIFVIARYSSSTTPKPPHLKE